MEQQELIRVFAQAIVERRFDDATACLAPWLRTAVDKRSLEEAVASALAQAAEWCAVDDPAWPSGFSVDQNEIDLEELRSGTPGLAPEVIEKNFTGWYCIQFGPETDDNAPFDLWVAMVRGSSGESSVGHLVFAGSD